MLSGQEGVKQYENSICNAVIKKGNKEHKE